MEESTYTVERMINQYRESGFDPDSIEMARKDMSRGVDIKVVDCYMNIRLTKAARLILAEAFHRGIPLSLGEKLAKKGEDYLREVMIHIDENVPFEVIENIVDTQKSAKHAQIAFKDYNEELQMIQAGTLKKNETTENSEAPATSTNSGNIAVEENHIPATDPVEPEKPKPERKKKKPVRTVFDTPEKPQEPAAPVIHTPELRIETEGVRRPADTGADINDNLIHLMEEVLKVNQLAISAMADRLTKEHNQKDEIPPYSPNAFPWLNGKKPEQTPENRPDREYTRIPGKIPEGTSEQTPESTQSKADKTGDMIDRIEVSKDASFQRMRAYADRSFSKPIHIEADESMPQPKFPYLDGYTRMILLPNGSLIPLEIERPSENRKKGFFAFASRLFGKKSIETSLLSQMISRRLSSDQLRMVKRAVREGLEAGQIRELIDSDFPPEQLNEIIDILLAKRDNRVDRLGEYAEVV